MKLCVCEGEGSTATGEELIDQRVFGKAQSNSLFEKNFAGGRERSALGDIQELVGGNEFPIRGVGFRSRDSTN